MTKDEKGCLCIKQGGYYYNVSGNDALILHKHLGYKIFGVNILRTGFPVLGRDVFLQKIDALSMNYDLYDQKGNLLISKRFTHNNYEVYDQSEFAQIAEELNIHPKDKMTKLSKRSQFIAVLQALGEDTNFYTGEVIEGIDEQLKSTLLEIMLYFDDKEKTQQRNKEQYVKRGQRWSVDEDDELIKEYNSGMDLKEMAKLHNRSRSAIHSRLLHLHLIKL